MLSFFNIKKTHLNCIFHIFVYTLPHIQSLLSIANLCHLHCHTKYIWSNVATTLLQRLSQTSSIKLPSNVAKTLCVSWGYTMWIYAKMTLLWSDEINVILSRDYFILKTMLLWHTYTKSYIIFQSTFWPWMTFKCQMKVTEFVLYLKYNASWDKLVYEIHIQYWPLMILKGKIKVMYGLSVYLRTLTLDNLSRTNECYITVKYLHHIWLNFFTKICM